MTHYDSLICKKNEILLYLLSYLQRFIRMVDNLDFD